MAQRTAAEIPILIVGAGPVGLALAADLGLRWVACLVIEQGEGPPDHPRASTLPHETDRTQVPEIAQDTAAGAQARRAMGEALVRAQTGKFITDGIALGNRYDPSSICWPELSAARASRSANISRHPIRAAGRRTPGSPLGDRPSPLSAAALRCCDSPMPIRSAMPIRPRSSRPSESGGCRSPSCRSRIRRRLSSMSAACAGAARRTRGVALRCPACRSARPGRPRTRRLSWSVFR
jgi:FAD binding domain